jgi:LysM repeat protein
MALEGGYQPLSEQYRYAAQGGLVGLEEGGQPSSLTAMSITPESQRVRNDTSQPQQNISNRFFDELESKGGIMSIMSRLLLRNNPEAIQFVNQNASSPRNLQLNEMGAGRHSYFDTADTGLYTKAGGGLVRLVEGGTPEQGVLQSQLSPVLQQQQQQIPLLQQQEQQISERARQDELLQRDQAMSRGQQFIEQPTGNQQLFQQMQSAGQVIGQQLAQGQQAYATPAGSKAPSTSFSTGADFGFNAGGLVGLAEGGIVSLRRGGEPDQIENVLPVTLQSTMKRLGIKDADPFLEFAQKTKQIESSGGINRINKKSSARGDFQWLTKVDPKAKKGVHNSVKTAVNRTISSYERMGQEIPQWLKTLNKNSTKSTKDLEENVLSLTPDQELELFFGNIGEAEGSDVYLTGIAQGDKEAMFGAYSDIHHTRGREDKPTKEKAVKVFFSETAPQVDRSSAPDLLEENMVDPRSNELYTVQPGDTLSKLAAKSGMTIEDLMSSNLSRISDPNKIYTGQQIALSDSPDIPNPVPVSEGDEDGLMNLIKNLLPDFITRAEGGEIGKYFEGQVVGNGDGMSDQILFEVEGNNPDKALLSRDEYVIPADVVAMLGNGSSNAGSEQLDGFIKGIRQDSFGTQKQQQQLNAQQGLRGLV